MAETELGKHTRIIGTERDTLTREVVDLYLNDEWSVREIAEDLGRSYGFVHRLLREAEVPLRPRGGMRKNQILNDAAS